MFVSQKHSHYMGKWVNSPYPQMVLSVKVKTVWTISYHLVTMYTPITDRNTVEQVPVYETVTELSP